MASGVGEMLAEVHEMKNETACGLGKPDTFGSRRPNHIACTKPGTCTLKTVGALSAICVKIRHAAIRRESLRSFSSQSSARFTCTAPPKPHLTTCNMVVRVLQHNPSYTHVRCFTQGAYALFQARVFRTSNSTTSAVSAPPAFTKCPNASEAAVTSPTSTPAWNGASRSLRKRGLATQQCPHVADSEFRSQPASPV
eukprot:1190649-Prorocentrum_minimum.AAC.3